MSLQNKWKLFCYVHLFIFQEMGIKFDWLMQVGKLVDPHITCSWFRMTFGSYKQWMTLCVFTLLFSGVHDESLSIHQTNIPHWRKVAEELTWHLYILAFIGQQTNSVWLLCVKVSISELLQLSPSVTNHF